MHKEVRCNTYNPGNFWEGMQFDSLSQQPNTSSVLPTDEPDRQQNTQYILN